MQYKGAAKLPMEKLRANVMSAFKRGSNGNTLKDHLGLGGNTYQYFIKRKPEIIFSGFIRILINSLLLACHFDQSDAF
jgi:hypothetical protein